MCTNGFETGGWQPPKEKKRTARLPCVLLLMGTVLLALFAIFLSRHLLEVQADFTVPEASSTQRPGAAASVAGPLQESIATITCQATSETESKAASQAAAQPLEASNGIPDDADYLLLVSAAHPLPEDYEPDDLVAIDSVVDLRIIGLKESNMLGTKVAVQALDLMLADAAKQGYANFQVADAYRSIPVQQDIWDRTYQKYLNENGLSPAKALQATQRRVAVPGSSEHHTGLAFDLSIPGESFRLTRQCAWIAENCWQYGFIVRYAEDKERITGISAEPWHIRFVGEEAASDIHREHLCLEEYLE